MRAHQRRRCQDVVLLLVALGCCVIRVTSVKQEAAANVTPAASRRDHAALSAVVDSSANVLAPDAASTSVASQGRLVRSARRLKADTQDGPALAGAAAVPSLLQATSGAARGHYNVTADDAGARRSGSHDRAHVRLETGVSMNPMTEFSFESTDEWTQWPGLLKEITLYSDCVVLVQYQTASNAMDSHMMSRHPTRVCQRDSKG
eukprot:TRINITY_DN15251_c0_g1_i1.p1 TRINITY_DN15251_c0_g1~~TRINITY_DN15251_c0_g1_i1.p1  ORF type:complete len:204 (-),score=25.59 TRINITY_DN15251_c0_g1_i1:150-761(-)